MITPKFPHYTWGYIVSKSPKKPKCRVPSLYVRVYRWTAGKIRPHTGSLTIREGISRCKNELTTCRKFPHYTWGYITRLIRCKPVWRVPSLYVRVYRWLLLSFQVFLSSLTIREGISLVPAVVMMHSRFPHYTWGYIIFPHLTAKSTFVPSLYVRVYHPGYPWELQPRGSLTIREGISTGGKTDDFWRTFPHYTWGYIVQAVVPFGKIPVPSLYVRVYHWV